MTKQEALPSDSQRALACAALRCSLFPSLVTVMSEIDKVPTDKEPLLESSQTNLASETPKETLSLLKYGSLGFLIVQNSSQCAEAHTSMAVHHSSASLCHRSPPPYAITCGRSVVSQRASSALLARRPWRVLAVHCELHSADSFLPSHSCDSPRICVKALDCA